MDAIKRFKHRIINMAGSQNSGTLFIVLAGIHGNEKAGIKGLENLFKHLELNNTKLNGKLVGIKGNLKALEEHVRYIHRDLNRQWYPAKIRKIHALPFSFLNNQEDREQKEILLIIRQLIHQHKSRDICLIDLHTTSATGSCFTIANNHPKAKTYAKMIGVPVITEITPAIKGTTLEYFDWFNSPAIAFEAGQHEDPFSIQNIEIALFSIFKQSGLINTIPISDFERRQQVLFGFAKGLPEVVKVIYRHPVNEKDNFKMNFGYHNFQPVIKGEFLATDKKGNIFCPADGLILMPLYQKKGNDGFFIVEVLE